MNIYGTDFSNVNIVIDVDDILGSIKDIEKIDALLQPAIELGLERAKERIIRKVKENLAKYGLLDDFGNNIVIEDSGNSFEIYVYKESKINGENYALFYEYGTGLAGQNNPHPDHAGYSGEVGWWYPTNENDPNPTKRRFKSGQLMAWTNSRASSPFMYDTYLWIKSWSPIKRDINRAIKEMLQ